MLIAGAWEHFLAGDRKRYLDTVASAIAARDGSADAIVLAQASMADAAGPLCKDLRNARLQQPAARASPGFGGASVAGPLSAETWPSRRLETVTKLQS